MPFSVYYLHVVNLCDSVVYFLGLYMNFLTSKRMSVRFFYFIVH